MPVTMTTPESLDLNRSIRQMVDAGVSDCFLEVSSHALSQKRVCGMNFDAGVFTNLSRDHLDFHGDMDEYKNAKAKLFRENLVNASREKLQEAEQNFETIKNGFMFGVNTDIQVTKANYDFHISKNEYIKAVMDYLLADLKIKKYSSKLSSKDIELINQWLIW